MQGRCLRQRLVREARQGRCLLQRLVREAWQGRRSLALAVRVLAAARSGAGERAGGRWGAAKAPHREDRDQPFSMSTVSAA